MEDHLFYRCSFVEGFGIPFLNGTKWG